jgi:folate-binding protein YgfZ
MPQALPNPLQPLHEQAQAEFQPYDQLQIVSTFGQPQAEYAAVRKACGMMDQPQRGVLELSGKDRHSFLNNLITNQVWNKETKQGLTAGSGVYAFYLNTKGRIVCDMNVLETGEQLWLDMDARLIEPVSAALGKFLFSEKVGIASRVGSLHQIALHGPGGPDLLGAACGQGERAAEFVALPMLGSTRVKLFDADAIVWRDDPTGAPGLHLIVPAEKAPAVWNGLLERFGAMLEHGKRALRPMGWAIFNTTRIEGGRALFGVDFDDTLLPAETGEFARAVSVTKGCYLGQEIVARMYARKQVARQIAGLRLENDALPIAGSRVYDNQQNEIGGITSSTISPLLSNAAICLALLKKPFFAPDTVVRVPAEGAMREARVVTTPFLPAPSR